MFAGCQRLVCPTPVRFFANAVYKPAAKQDQEKVWRFLAGFGLETHADKFYCWNDLQMAKKHHLVVAGIDKPQHRKLILRKVEAWKQEQRWKLSLLANSNDERLDAIEAAAHAATLKEYDKYMEFIRQIEENQEVHSKRKEKEYSDQQDVKMQTRLDRIRKGLPVFKERFPKGHMLHGLSEAEVIAVHADYHDRMFEGQAEETVQNPKLQMLDSLVDKAVMVLARTNVQEPATSVPIAEEAQVPQSNLSEKVSLSTPSDKELDQELSTTPSDEESSSSELDQDQEEKLKALELELNEKDDEEEEVFKALEDIDKEMNPKSLVSLPEMVDEFKTSFLTSPDWKEVAEDITPEFVTEMNEFLGQVTLSDLGIKEEETPKNAETDEEEEIPEDASADSDFGDEILDSESGSESEKEFGVKKRNK